jgi:hypothetical protein
MKQDTVTMKYEATDFNLNDKIDNYIICINEGQKMWTKISEELSEELSEEPYLLGDNPILIEQNKKKNFFSHINGNSAPVKIIKNKSIYHQFIKDKIIEFANTYPKLTKKERYTMVLNEWKNAKNK